MDVSQFLRVLRAHWIGIVAMVAVGVALLTDAVAIGVNRRRNGALTHMWNGPVSKALAA